jgi:hypothetical protein
MSSAAMWSADERRGGMLGEGQLGLAVHRPAQIDHVVEDGIDGFSSPKRSAIGIRSAQRLRRSRAMWVT